MILGFGFWTFLRAMVLGSTAAALENTALRHQTSRRARPGAAGRIMRGRNAHTSAPRPLCAWCAMMVAFLSQFGPVWACLDHLRALSIEYLEQGDLAFNQGVPGSIPGRLTKSFGYFRHRLVAQPGTMVAYRWRAVATRPLPLCHGLEGLPLTGAASPGGPAHRVHR